ncbi:MAG: phosphatidylserine decarboxylase [Pseudohongiellaceae bacterium]|jgi:phosphatidylserine decarboxylase
MRWPFTTYATGTLLLSTLPLAALSLTLARGLSGFWWIIPLPLMLFFAAFFRDPERQANGGEEDLVSPADGVVADIVTVDDPALGEPATRIGIFLSVFNVHVNRVPCAGEVTQVTERDGGFLDARNPRASEENRAATLSLRRPDGRTVAVRQITGLIARRILCPVTVGQSFSRGQRYGMIRFGSRTELIVPTSALAETCCKIGDSVKGGETLLAILHPAARSP